MITLLLTLILNASQYLIAQSVSPQDLESRNSLNSATHANTVSEAESTPVKATEEPILSVDLQAPPAPTEPSHSKLVSPTSQLNNDVKTSIVETTVEAPIENSSWGLSADFFTYQTNQAHPDQPSLLTETTNILRLALHFEHTFTRNLKFKTQLGYYNGGPESHTGGTDQLGSSLIEFAYVEHSFSQSLSLRLGHQLIPIGYSNLDPNGITRVSVNPPELESELIPFGWHENGFLIVKNDKYINSQLGVFNSLDAREFNSTGSSRDFLNDGVQNGRQAKAQDLMGILRIDGRLRDQELGASVVHGDTAQDSGAEQATLTLWDVHTSLRWNQLSLTGVYSQAHMKEAVYFTSPAFFEKADGYYLTLANEWGEANHRIILFVRQSQYDLNKVLPPAIGKDLTLQKERTTIGLNYLPHPNLVYKVQYVWRKNAAQDEADTFQLGASIIF